MLRFFVKHCISTLLISVILIHTSFHVKAQKILVGKVVGITDGDTFKMLVDDSVEYKIRLHGIDCPEKAQAFSQVAKKALSDMIFGQEIKVEYTKKDRYGRIIGKVYFGKLYVNEELIKQGMAWHFTKYDQNTEWQNLEQEARAQKIGLWADSDPMAPWLYRENKKKQTQTR